MIVALTIKCIRFRQKVYKKINNYLIILIGLHYFNLLSRFLSTINIYCFPFYLNIYYHLYEIYMYVSN